MRDRMNLRTDGREARDVGFLGARFLKRLGLFGALLPALFSSCNSEPLILLDLDAWPETTTQLRLRTTLNGTPGQLLTYMQNERRIALYLPSGSAGTLQIDFSAVDSSDCELAVSSLTEPVPGGLPRASERTVSFSPPGPHTCLATSSMPVDFTGVVATDPKTIYAIGNGGAMVRCSGAPLTCMPVVTGTIATLSGIFTPSSTSVLISGDNATIGDCNSGGCKLANYAAATRLLSVWANDPLNIFAVGTAGAIVRCQGANGQCTPLTSGVSADLVKVYGADANHVFAVGLGGALVACTNTTSWTCGPRVSASSGTLTDLFAPSISAVWAVGLNSTIVRCDTSSCQPLTVNTTNKSNLMAVFGTDVNNIWAVGTAGTIVRCMGGSCMQVSSGTTADLYSVWGSDVNTIYAVGDSGTMLRCTGTTCASLNKVTQSTLYSVYGKDIDHVYAVGKAGAIVRYLP